ncbi:MAG: flagellar motor protein MotA [Geminicoccaceae bacterium]
MSNPQRFINRMIVFLALAVAAVVFAYETFIGIFMYNPFLNGLILLVLLISIFYVMRRVWMLKPEIRWIEGLRTSKPGYAIQAAPFLLTPVAHALGEQERRGRVMLPANSVRYLLDSIASRLDEQRDITRYATGLLIFLGLIGTFWGLLGTIGSVSDVIAGLSVSSDGDIATVFDELKTGLAAPMEGMGTAFSSSLFGLAGSLILGFLDLQATQGQNAFYNEMEEWLTSLTRLSSAEPTPSAASGVVSAGSDVPIPAYLQALMEQTAENMQNMQRSIERSEENQRSVQSSMVGLTERLTTLGDQISTEQALLGRLISNQDDLRPVLARLAEGDASAIDETTRNHIRNMDVYLARILDEAVQGRSQMTNELRSEIKMVARTIAAVASGGEPSGSRRSSAD